MFIIFNLVIVGLVLLIAYWWANEGLFSAVIHMVCVIVAGAFAFAIWESTAQRLLSLSFFEYSGLGIALVTVFVVSLLLLRIACDKIIPANIQFPTWANYAFGGFAGLVSGVLSIGICLIGAGFVQSTGSILEYKGTARADTGNKIEKVNSLWLDVGRLTASFYGKISVGTMHPDLFGGMPLQQYNPRVDEQATLLRDTYEGKGQIVIGQKDADVTGFLIGETDNGQDIALAMVNFRLSAGDFGKQVILAKSQVRLVTESINGEEPKIYFPSAWQQMVQGEDDEADKEFMFEFEGTTSYATSIPRQDHAIIKFIFRTDNSELNPKYLQIKNTRFDIPSIGELQNIASYMPSKSGQEFVDRGTFGNDIQNQITTKDRFRYRASANDIPSTVILNEKFYITDAEAFNIHKGKISGHGGNTIRGVSADPGTGIVFLDASPGKPSSFYDLFKTHADEPIEIVDSLDRPYKPIGYFIFDSRQLALVVHPNAPIMSMRDIKNFATKIRPGKDIEFKLIFMVTADVTIEQFRVGDTTIGHCSLEVKEQRQR